MQNFYSGLTVFFNVRFILLIFSISFVSLWGGVCRARDSFAILRPFYSQLTNVSLRLWRFNGKVIDFGKIIFTELTIWCGENPKIFLPI